MEFLHLSHPLSGLSGLSILRPIHSSLDMWTIDQRYRRMDSGYEIIMVFIFQEALRGVTPEAILRSHWAPSICPALRVYMGLFAELVVSCSWDLSVVSGACLHLLQLCLSLGALLCTHHLIFFSISNEPPWPLTFIFHWLGYSFPAQ